MLIFDRENWPYHRSWCLAVVLGTVVAAGWYLAYGFGSGGWQWPGGSSPPGFTFGVIGGLIMAFEMLLWPRKSLWRGWRLGRTKIWMTAHLWLGLFTLPLLLLHGDFRFDPSRSTLAVVLMWLLVIVVASGIFGATMQNIVPRLMLERVPAETIHAQIGHVLGLYRDEADELVRATVGEPRGDAPVEGSRRGGKLESVAVMGGGKGQYVADSEPLVDFFHQYIEPYLTAATGDGLPLASPRRADAIFRSIKRNLRVEAHPVVDRLAALCDERRQFDLQSRMHHWLHNWLAVHVAFSVALFLLMIVHIVMALKYV